jgi:hypothetical protein
MCIGQLGQRVESDQYGFEYVNQVLSTFAKIDKSAVKVPQPPTGEGGAVAEPELPVTLVRIPAQSKDQNGMNGT